MDFSGLGTPRDYISKDQTRVGRGGPEEDRYARVRLGRGAPQIVAATEVWRERPSGTHAPRKNGTPTSPRPRAATRRRGIST